MSARTVCVQLDASEYGTNNGVDRLFFILNGHYEPQWVRLPQLGADRGCTGQSTRAFQGLFALEQLSGIGGDLVFANAYRLIVTGPNQLREAGRTIAVTCCGCPSSLPAMTMKGR